MRVVPIAQAAPGMKLAQAVTDAAGNLLLPEGMVLTADALMRLRARKVAELGVEGEDSAAGGGGAAVAVDPAAAAAKLDEELDALFADVCRHPVMEALHAAAKSVLKAKLGA